MTDTAVSDQTITGNKWSLLEFSLLCCYSVGIHGTTSLPYYVQNFSAVFLVAYFVLLVLICIPVCYVQIKLGAVYRRGIVGIFSHLVPILKGSAVALLLMTYIRCLVNGLELSYSLYYAFVSFEINSNDDYKNPRTQIFPSEYFHKHFLQTSDHIGDGGCLVWYIVLCLLATWIIIYLLSFKGFASIGKIIYVLAPLSLVLLFTLFVYAFATEPPDVPIFHQYKIIPKEETVIKDPVTNKTYVDNIPTIEEEQEHQPDPIFSLTDLGHPKPWVSALLLHMNSVGLWSGILPSLGSQIYNKKRIINASWIILLLVYGTLPLVVLFAFARFYLPACNQGMIATPKANGIKPGLAHLMIGMFASLRQVPFIALCCYLVVFLFGLLHEVLHLITIWETLLPAIPTPVMKFIRRREYLVAIACLISFLISLPFTSQAGIFIYMFINSYVDRLIFTLIIISMVPFITGYIKQEYLYLPVERACMSLWYGLASLIPSAMLIYYFAVYVYPYSVVGIGYDQRWADNIGWVIAAAPIALGLIFGAVHAVYNEKGSLKQRCIQALKTDSLRTTDSSNDYDISDTVNTGLHASKMSSSSGGSRSNTMNGNQSNESNSATCKTETEVVIKPPDDSDISKI